MTDPLDQLLARLEQDRLIQQEATPTPRYTYNAPGESGRVELLDSFGNALDARPLSSGGFRAGEPVVHGAGMVLGRPKARPKQRRRFAPPVAPVGVWVWSNLQGTAEILLNEANHLQYSFNTRPNSNLHEDTIAIGIDPGNPDYFIDTWLRAINLQFAQIITVTTPTQIRVVQTNDYLAPIYTAPVYASWTSSGAGLQLHAYLLQPGHPALVSTPLEIFNDAVAKDTAGDVDLNVFIQNDLVPQGVGEPWNQYYYVQSSQYQNPIFGIDYLYNTRVLASGQGVTEGTREVILPIPDPGTYLILGAIGLNIYFPVDYYGGTLGSFFVDTFGPIVDPDNNLILWQQITGDVYIEPIPPVEP